MSKQRSTWIIGFVGFRCVGVNGHLANPHDWGIKGSTGHIVLSRFCV